MFQKPVRVIMALATSADLLTSAAADGFLSQEADGSQPPESEKDAMISEGNAPDAMQAFVNDTQTMSAAPATKDAMISEGNAPDAMKAFVNNTMTISSAPATKQNQDSCVSRASAYTITGWKTYICRKTVCVTADPGYFLEKTTMESHELSCRGRRDPCCSAAEIHEYEDMQIDIGGGTMVTVSLPKKICVNIEAEGKKEVGVTGRGECKVVVQQKAPR